jgi:NAD(P)-dependent dehydrogenase (short-subunit alcohol dehydrogenase family)
MSGGYPDPSLFVAADISTPAGGKTVIDRVGERFGVVDILVHTVGGSHASSGGFAALSDAQWQDELNLNLLAAVRLDRGAAAGNDPGRVRRHRARVVDPAAHAAV